MTGDHLSVLPPEREAMTSYRDELNFAEFPLAALTDQVPRGQKTLHFTDSIFDTGRKQMVTRKLTISASDKYGLPTALDDEVILGLIQLTHRDRFATPRVHFTRYELIKLLGWRDESKSYERIAESLQRWVGVTLYYDKAWWSKEEQCWVNESFHILEQVTLMDRERRSRLSARRPDDPTAGLSSIVWNSVVFNSFKSGYLKQIDLELYKSLESRVAKRIYRFLDKRFYQRSRHEFDLRTFACEHVGLSKGYHNGEIKRKLRPAIAELERVKFLKPRSEAERFKRARRGEWTVVFEKQGRAEAEVGEEAEPLARELVELGLTESTARELVLKFDTERIVEKVGLTRWLLGRKDQRVSQNPAGFLYSAVVKDYALPPDYQRTLGVPEKKTSPKLQRPPKQEDPAPEKDEERETLDAYWAALTPEEQARFEAAAVKLADKFLLGQYEAGREAQGMVYRSARQLILDQHIRRTLATSKAA